VAVVRGRDDDEVCVLIHKSSSARTQIHLAFKVCTTRPLRAGRCLSALTQFSHNRCMDTVVRLNSLIGKQGLLKIRDAGQVEFTFLSVTPPATEMRDF
jgi:hypothetical protein